MKKLIYCSQAKDKSGYGIASRKYIESIVEYIESNELDIDLKLYIIRTGFQIDDGLLSSKMRDIISKYEFTNDEEINDFIKDGQARCIWHMPTIMGITSDFRFKTEGYSPSLNKIIKSCYTNTHFIVWETSDINESWKSSISYINPDSIVTACEMNKKTFMKYSDNVKIIPHPVDELSDRAIPVHNVKLNKNNFNIFTTSQWTDRKGKELLIAAYLSEFKDHDDVALTIKTYTSAEYRSQEDIINNIKKVKFCIDPENKSKCKINLLTNFISFDNMNWLYKKSDLFCSLTKGEGYGLTIMESIVRGIPVLVPKEGGHIDYVDRDNSFLVDGMWDTCIYRDVVYTADSDWFICNIKDARKKMREAYNLWKENKLSEIGLRARDHILSLEDYKKINVGKNFVEHVFSIEKPVEIPKKQKINHLKRVISSTSDLKEKMDILENSFEGETCYILNCGPSLNDVDENEFRQFLKDKNVLSIKQAYNKFAKETDFHFFNCSNLPHDERSYLPQHYKYNNNTIAIASSNYDLGARWHKIQKTDIFFKIPIRTEINNEFVSVTKAFDEFIISDNLVRPCGPGIMYETVIYMAMHLGFKKIIAIGWDLSQDSPSEDNYEHFYGSTKSLINRGDILPWEIEVTRNATKELFYWLKDKGIELELLSDKSKLYENIPRVKFEDIK